MWYGILADLIVAIHVAYVGYVLVGQAIILLGAALRWQWIRNPWFRLTHLAAILVVAFEAIWGITCPLTTWEGQLRAAGGEEVSQSTFIGRFLDSILFYDVDPRILNWVYIGFAVLVLGTLVLVPPRRSPSALIPGPGEAVRSVAAGLQPAQARAAASVAAGLQPAEVSSAG